MNTHQHTSAGSRNRNTKTASRERPQNSFLQPARKAEIVPFQPPASPAGVSGVGQYGNLLSKKQTLQKVGHGLSWLHAQMRAGRFVPCVYIGRNPFFPEAWVDQWIEAQYRAQAQDIDTTACNTDRVA